jgi:hypothetical protein
MLHLLIKLSGLTPNEHTLRWVDTGCFHVDFVGREYIISLNLYYLTCLMIVVLVLTHPLLQAGIFQPAGEMLSTTELVDDLIQLAERCVSMFPTQLFIQHLFYLIQCSSLLNQQVVLSSWSLPKASISPFGIQVETMVSVTSSYFTSTPSCSHQ